MRYGAMTKWAKDICEISEPELREKLTEAAGLEMNYRGITGLPIALRQRCTTEAHVVRVLRVLGVRKAVTDATEEAGAELELAPGAAGEFDRLLSLTRYDLSKLAASCVFIQKIYKPKLASCEELFGEAVRSAWYMM